jgi:hypothetical protein
LPAPGDWNHTAIFKTIALFASELIMLHLKLGYPVILAILTRIKNQVNKEFTPEERRETGAGGKLCSAKIQLWRRHKVSTRDWI